MSMPHGPSQASQWLRFACLIALSLPARAAVTPIADCMRVDHQTKIMTVAYGYSQPGPDTTVLSLSDDKFFPAPLYRGQPFAFYPGTHHRVFEVTFNLTDFPTLTWTLDGTSLVTGFDAAAGGPFPVTPAGLGLCQDADKPVLAAVLPAAGAVAGGTRIVVTGQNFAAAAGATNLYLVDTGGPVATQLDCLSDTLCTAMVPAPSSGTTGSTTLQVSTLQSGAGNSLPFDYAAAIAIGTPGLAAISPDRGPNTGGLTVTLSGTNFQTDGSTAVYFGAAAATAVACPTSTTCTATAPPGTGDQPVFVVTAGGASDPSQAAARFHYGQAGIAALVSDPAHPGVVYAVANGLGVYSSVDGGQYWQAASGGLATADVRALAVAADGNTVYAGTYGGGVYASAYHADGQLAWSAINGSGAGALGDLQVKSLALKPGVAGGLYAGTQSGVYCSGDQGISWSACSHGLP